MRGALLLLLASSRAYAQNTMDLGTAFQLIRDGGSLLLLTVAIVGAWRGWYVWRREYDRLDQERLAAIADRDAWRDVALDRAEGKLWE